MLDNNDLTVSMYDPSDVDCPQDAEYDSLTPYDWFEYEFATIEYDYQIHPEAAKQIRQLVKRLM